MTMSFSLQIAAWVNKTKDDTNRVLRYALMGIDTRLVQKSPVGDAKYWISPPPKGYVGGRFRANWQMSIGAPPSGTLSGIDQSEGGTQTIDSHAAVYTSVQAGQVIYLVNNLPYAKRIENGWSRRQAPIGIVALTVLEWQKIIDKAVDDVRATSAEDFTQGYQSYGL
ncbi:hypothetical protein [Duganella sp. BJB475]|uniref:hypothetical protein n=1 Tax=Duganella sp. BJB475 TaxID=2233914 RepID=UPI001314B548|nr:hypothetical protein [Duganella sp. BJB475]